MNKKTRKKDTGKPKITREEIVEILKNKVRFTLGCVDEAADEIMKRLEG